MKAILFRSYGGPEVLEVADVPQAAPGPDEVLIEVHAVGVNPRDWMLRQGTYVGRGLVRGWPKIPGSDVSGVIAGLGSRVRDFKVGDEVFAMQTALGNMGAYAEYICVSASAVAHKPDGISHAEAAAVPVAGLTALQGLRNLAHVQGGDRVTVIGASGGVGHYAVQVARILGCEVTAVCGPDNQAFVRELGAQHTVDYRVAPPQESVREQDVIFDVMGRESLASCKSMLAQDGLYLTTIPSPRAAFDAGFSSVRRRLVRKGQQARPVLVVARGEDLECLAEWMQQGKLRSVIEAEFPLEKAAEAQVRSRTFRTRGKLVLKVR